MVAQRVTQDLTTLYSKCINVATPISEGNRNVVQLSLHGPLCASWTQNPVSLWDTRLLVGDIWCPIQPPLDNIAVSNFLQTQDVSSWRISIINVDKTFHQMFCCVTMVSATLTKNSDWWTKDQRCKIGPVSEYGNGPVQQHKCSTAPVVFLIHTTRRTTGVTFSQAGFFLFIFRATSREHRSITWCAWLCFIKGLEKSKQTALPETKWHHSGKILLHIKNSVKFFFPGMSNNPKRESQGTGLGTKERDRATVKNSHGSTGEDTGEWYSEGCFGCKIREVWHHWPWPHQTPGGYILSENNRVSWGPCTDIGKTHLSLSWCNFCGMGSGTRAWICVSQLPWAPTSVTQNHMLSVQIKALDFCVTVYWSSHDAILETWGCNSHYFRMWLGWGVFGLNWPSWPTAIRDGGSWKECSPSISTVLC